MLCTVIVIVGCLFGYAKNTKWVMCRTSVEPDSASDQIPFPSQLRLCYLHVVPKYHRLHLQGTRLSRRMGAHEPGHRPGRRGPSRGRVKVSDPHGTARLLLVDCSVLRHRLDRHANVDGRECRASAVVSEPYIEVISADAQPPLAPSLQVSPVYTGISDVPSKDYGAPAQLLTESLPRPVAFFVLLLIVVGMQFQDIAQLLASSRFIWALARDSALPFSTYFQKLSKSTKIPVRSTWAVCMVAAPPMLLILINRAISTTLILSGCGTSLFLAYAMPVACYLTCPNGALDTDGRNEWTLRRWSKPLAWIAMTYVGLIVILMCVPKDLPVTASECEIDLGVEGGA